MCVQDDCQNGFLVENANQNKVACTQCHRYMCKDCRKEVNIEEMLFLFSRSLNFIFVVIECDTNLCRVLLKQKPLIEPLRRGAGIFAGILINFEYHFMSSVQKSSFKLVSGSDEVVVLVPVT